MKRNHTRLSIILGVLALAATSGCTKTAQTAPPIFAVPVTVAKVTQKNIPIDLTAIGSADANSSVSIKAQVNAVLDEVHIKEGQFVTITYDSGAKSTTIRVLGGGGSATVSGVDFMKATWSIWFGKIDQPSLGDALISKM